VLTFKIYRILGSRQANSGNSDWECEEVGRMEWRSDGGVKGQKDTKTRIGCKYGVPSKPIWGEPGTVGFETYFLSGNGCRLLQITADGCRSRV
jgi:hypothetical protein